MAHSLNVPVWCTLGIGRRLPAEYVNEIADRVLAGAPTRGTSTSTTSRCPLVTHVATVDGVTDDVRQGLRPECGFVPELLRVSPM